MKYMHIALIKLLIVLFHVSAPAQIEIGTALMSRYIWRGVDYGNSPSVQPSLTFTAGGFSVGTWGAYSIAGNGDEVFSEHDLWVGYTVLTSGGSFSLLATDYHYPSAHLRYFDYSGNGEGAHTLEAGLLYTGPDAFPVSLFAAANFHNDPDNSVYLELGYSRSINDVEIVLFAGGTPGKSDWYGTPSAAIINVGIGVICMIAVTDRFSVPVSASFIINPELEQSHLVFGIQF
jgi:hypothetical protein